MTLLRGSPWTRYVSRTVLHVPEARVPDVLYGDYNPSGKLPVTFYASDSQLPDYEDYGMPGHTYRFLKEKPLFAFCHGLSYTGFEVVRARVRFVRLVVKVRNTGHRDGTETVQLYVRRPGDVAGPLKTLRGFRRVDVPAGRTRRSVIRLEDRTFDWWSNETQRVQPLEGEYELLVRTSSEDDGLKVLKYKYKG